MGLVFGIISLIFSLILGYQGACVYEFLPDTLHLLSLGVSDINVILYFLSVVIPTWGIVLAVVGACVSVMSILRFKRGEDTDKTLCTMCAIISIFGVLSVL